MKKALAAFGVLSAALVLLVAPVSAQTPGDIKATITAAPASPTAGAPVNATTVFSIPSLSATGAQVQRHLQRGPRDPRVVHPGPVVLPDDAGTSVTCTWSTPDSAAPQTIVISVPGAGTSMTFTALRRPRRPAHPEGHDDGDRGCRHDDDSRRCHHHGRSDDHRRHNDGGTASHGGTHHASLRRPPRPEHCRQPVATAMRRS